MSEPVVVQDAGEVEDAGEPAGTGVRADVLWVLGTYVALGVVGGLLWWLLTEPAYFTKGDSGGLGMGEVQLARRFSADGWFAVIAAVLGLLSGGALTWWRSRDHLLTAVLLVVGSCLASALMAVLGWLLGPSAPDTVAASAAVGDRIATQLEVTADVCYLVWPIAVLGGALLVLWSPPADTPGSWGRNRS